MYRVDVDSILRQNSNANKVQIRYPNPSYNNVEPKLNDFESDEFRMYCFKIKRCPLNQAHDWTNCPYAHSGERAKRRDPLQVPYMAVMCPDYQALNGFCSRGEQCLYAHGVFEYWLHPTKYRTRVCNAGNLCSRSVCFFAHSLNERRIVPTNHIPSGSALLRSDPEIQARVLPTTDVASSSTSNINSAQELGVFGHPTMSNTPNAALLDSSTSSTRNERPQELKLEFLESLRCLTVNEYYDNQFVRNDVRTNANLNPFNVDWVSDLLDN